MTQATESTTRRTLILRLTNRRMRMLYTCQARHSRFGFFEGFNGERRPNGKWALDLAWNNGPTGGWPGLHGRLTAWQELKMAWLILVGTIGRKVDEWQR